MNIYCIFFSLLVASCAGASFIGDGHSSKVKATNSSSCTNPDGCKQNAAALPVTVATPSGVPVVQAVPWAMPFIMMWEGFPSERFHAMMPQEFASIDGASGVRQRLAVAVLVIALLGYIWAGVAVTLETDLVFHSLIEHGTVDSLSSRKRASLIETAGEASLMPDDLESADDREVEMDLTDLIQDTGVSGLCVLHPWEGSVSSGWATFWVTLAISLQGLLLQGGLLFYMLFQLQPQFSLPPEKRRREDLPLGLVFIALYIHFLNVAQDIPYSYQLLKHFGDFHKNRKDQIMMAPILITDSVIIPCLVVLIGSLYIAIARHPVDIVLNSVAVAFVKDIDNWILSLVSRASFFSGTLKDRKVRFPVDKKEMRQLLIWVCYVPVVPVIMVAGMLYLALYVLKM